MIAVFVATATLCVLTCKEAPSARRLIASLAAGLLLFFLASGMFTHMCLRGNPGTQILLWTAGLAAILSCVTDWKVAALGALILCIAMGTLCSQYVNMVHRPELTGDPGRWENRHLKYIADRVQKSLLEKSAKDAGTYPAAWLLESHFIDKDLKDTLGEPPQQAEVSPLWHTTFTHLWARKAHNVALWYPGGTLSEAASHLEWRECVVTR
jgi:hypothetical protein